MIRDPKRISMGLHAQLKYCLMETHSLKLFSPWHHFSTLLSKTIYSRTWITSPSFRHATSELAVFHHVYTEPPLVGSSAIVAEDPAKVVSLLTIINIYWSSTFIPEINTQPDSRVLYCWNLLSRCVMMYACFRAICVGLFYGERITNWCHGGHIFGY